MKGKEKKNVCSESEEKLGKGGVICNAEGNLTFLNLINIRLNCPI